MINFTDGITFEVLPAFALDDGALLYPNANWGGSWKRCNPRAEMAEIQAVSDATNRNLKYLCRMMRLWRDYWSVPISGMLIDTLAYRFIRNWPSADKSFLYHDWMARDFLVMLSSQNRQQSYWYAPGSNSTVYRTGSFERHAAQAYQLALEAIAFDAKGQSWSRRARWRQVFGSLYPNSD